MSKSIEEIVNLNSNEIYLVRPNKNIEKQIMDYRNEFLQHGEDHINGSCSLHLYNSLEEWYDRVSYCATDENNKYYGTITSTFLVFRKSDNKIIGTIQIRHVLTQELRDDSGNIGYAVRPTERRKGYATKMLMLSLEFCRQLGLERVLLDCDDKNIASANTMKKCGAVFDRVQPITESDGTEVILHQYWIDL